MDKQQLQTLIVIPTLADIPHGLTTESVMAVMMIIAHESMRGEFVKQISGPALGPGQMEPFTHDQTWKWGDSIWDNALELDVISTNDYHSKIHPPAERMIYDWRYAVFMIRQRLFMKPGKLPSDPKELSKYLKKHWNSADGKAGEFSYYRDWLAWK